MAKYRQVHVEFWQDGFVLDLTPEEKYFFLYLMTNSKTSQCGIYELPKKIIETETGYNRETVDKLLDRFVQYGKIFYNEPTREIMLINWIKYNRINSPKVKACIEKELQKVKHTDFVDMFHDSSLQYGYRINTLCIDLGEEEEEEEEEEKEYKDKTTKKKYAEFVSMKESEYQKLVDEHGQALTKKMIDTLDNYKGAKGKKYKSDYRAILSWVRDKVLKENNTQQDKKVLTNDDFLF